MPSTIEKQLQKIEQLIIHGKFQEAEKVIEEELKKKGLSKEDRLACKVLKSDIQNDLGKHKEALALAEEVLKESSGLDNALLQLDALIQKAGALFLSTGKANDALNYIEEGLELLKTIPSDVPAKELAERKALLLNWKGSIIFFHLGDFSKSIELLQESLSFAEESGNKRIIALGLFWLGIVYLFLSDYMKKAEEYLVKAKKTAEEIGNKLLLSLSYSSLGALLGRKKEFDQAIELYKKSFSFVKEVGSTFFVDIRYNDLGLIYQTMFQLDKALECFQKALKGMVLGRHMLLSNIGYTNFLKYELEQAQEYYLKSLKICEEINDRRVLPGVLYNLISISIELKNLLQAQKYLERLKEISVEMQLERIGQIHSFAHIMLLKASGNISDLVKAAELLKAFLKEEDLPAAWHMLVDWRLEALYTLLEIRIKELQLSASEATLTEVKKQTIRLEVEAEEQQQRWLLANVYRLQSQIALIELDAEKAVKLLEKSQNIAEEIDIEILRKEISEDQEKIQKQMGMWNKLQERKAPLSETVKLISLESTVKNIKQETVLEEHDEETGKIIEYRKLFALKI